jgi:hypothetical protein
MRRHNLDPLLPPEQGEGTAAKSGIPAAYWNVANVRGEMSRFRLRKTKQKINTMRKRRTREHIIADSGYNHCERQVLLAGHVMTKVTSDYGYDGLVNTFDQNGEMEHNFFLMQVKSTEHIKFSSKNQGYELTMSERDLSHWLFNPIPVAAVLYDFKKYLAYYLHVQAYFLEKNIELRKINKYAQVFIPSQNVLTPDVVDSFRTTKNPLK